jgi:hypothetical protein
MTPSVFMKTPRLVSGTEAVRAAEALRKEQAKRDQWPFEWVYPPPDADPVTTPTNLTTNADGDSNGIILAPAPGIANQVVVCNYHVPSGYNFLLTHLVLAYNGGNFTAGDMNWTVDKNSPLGTSPFQASVVQGFALVQVPLGSIAPQYSEFPLAKNEIFAPEDVIRAKVYVSNNINSGYFTAIFKGWIWPSVKGF